MQEITNIAVQVGSGYPYEKFISASWYTGGARFHVWFDVTTKELRRQHGSNKIIVYKNPPLEIGSNSPEFFRTRYLDGDKPRNAAIMRHVFDVVEREGLIAKGIAVFEKAEAERQAVSREAMRHERIRDAGVRLLALVKRWRDNEGQDDCCLPVLGPKCQCKKCETKKIIAEIDGA